MEASIYHTNLAIRRWTTQLEKSLGLRLEPHFLVVIATIVIISLQIVLSLTLNSSTIYCQIPNMRFFYMNKPLPDYEKLPTIYVVTPTYERYVQKAELIRLSHTLMLVPNVYWIIVEDAERQTDMVSKFVRNLKNQYDFHSITHLQEPTPPRFKLVKGEPSWKKPKGVWQRNRALAWIRENMVDLDRDGVVYFADDDNTYDLELFNEMRYTRKVSVWPVAFVGGLLIERPILSGHTRRVHKFNSMWERKRPFPLDMAGFAVSLHLLMGHPHAQFSADQKIGYVESHFLSQLINSWDELEPRADKCTKTLVWHTRTQSPTLHEERKLSKPSNSDIEW